MRGETVLRDKVRGQLHERCVKNVLDIIILAILKDRTVGLGAYDLIASIHNKFNVLISPGAIYPKLFSLHREGLINAEWRTRKKVYCLSDKGSEVSEIFFDCFIDVNRRLFNFVKTGVEEKTKKDQSTED